MFYYLFIKILTYFPNLLELSFLTVFEFPSDSSIGEQEIIYSYKLRFFYDFSNIFSDN
jgi:hypothetical protein